MFSFFKSAKEKQLEKLGYQLLIQSYKEKVKTKEWTKKEFSQAIDDLYNEKKAIVSNATNINVATRQSFDDDETMVPLNLQNIQQEFIDYDFIYSSLIFEYNNYKRIHTKALNELTRYLNNHFPDAVINEEDAQKISAKELKELINEASNPINDSNKNYLKAVFNELQKRL